MADPKVKRLLKFIQANIQKSPHLWHVWIFASKFTNQDAFIFTAICYYPWRWVYSYNNRERSYEVAYKREMAHKEKLNS
jgi:hypothetical protein